MPDENESQVSAEIPIRPPFTLDKYWDPAEPSNAHGSFQELSNYIVKKGSVETRKGITEFSFT
jgi:hypothetical protein